MSKKVEEEKTVTEEEVKTKPKKASKTTKKKEVKKQSSKKNVELELQVKSLVEFVNDSDISRKKLLILLDRKGYLSQFYEEEDMMKSGLYVKPTVTEDEFNKIIGE